jgi:hypothetical protein
LGALYGGGSDFPPLRVPSGCSARTRSLNFRGRGNYWLRRPRPMPGEPLTEHGLPNVPVGQAYQARYIFQSSYILRWSGPRTPAVSAQDRDLDSVSALASQPLAMSARRSSTSSSWRLRHPDLYASTERPRPHAAVLRHLRWSNCRQQRSEELRKTSIEEFHPTVSTTYAGVNPKETLDTTLLAELSRRRLLLPAAASGQLAAHSCKTSRGSSMSCCLQKWWS